ncbi:sterol desaturase family protein [Thalassomonas viridans]|uniref:Sterol desaturase family protein n=1 Tax=Thalassomonas viridans TaxID=137584 RepID=A0AAE9Z171_9GAMM|nr:sterol desaturase family protein [Thalassomonas viridans]WDE04144.1 sterol desaturase family protein [Thalassomonas viridans]
MNEYNINALAIPLFLVFMLAEYGLLRLKGQKLHRLNDSIASLSMGMLLLISDALLKAYTFAVFIYLFDQHRLFEFSPYAPVTWLLFFFAVDFCYYWFHRCAHQFNFLWGAHVGHHQSEEYNLTTALRQSAFQYAFSWVFYLPLALLGCPPQVFLVLFILLKLYQFWLHTQLIGKIPYIEGIFSTPSSHRVHHAKNPIYIDKNYGGTLVIWDRLFGSWQPELTDEPCHYGTSLPLDTLNPVKANLQHWWMLAKDTAATRSGADKLRLWFKPTGWRPTDCSNKDATHPVPLQKTGCGNRKKYDPHTSPAIKCYAALSMLMTFYLCFAFIFLSPGLSSMQLVLGSGLIVISLICVNGLLENKLGYLAVESLRLPLALYFGVSLWAPLALAFTGLMQTL